MKQTTKRTILVVIGFIGYFMGVVIMKAGEDIGLLFWLIGSALMFWGCYIWVKLKGRSGWHALWALLTWLGFIIIFSLKDKSTPRLPSTMP